MRFPHDPVKLDDLTIYNDLLVWIALLTGFKKFNTVFCSFLFLVFIHHCKVVALRMEVHLEWLCVIECLYGCLTGGNFNESDTWMLVITRKSCIDEDVSVWWPEHILNAVDGDWLFNSIWGLYQFHRWKLVDAQTSFIFNNTPVFTSIFFTCCCGWGLLLFELLS